MNLYLYLTTISSCLAVVNANCLAVPEVANARTNATLPGPYPDGTVVQMSCNDGFTPSGQRIYVCSGSSWINGNFECEEIFCRHVETPTNGFLTDSPTYEVGSFMTFGCDVGYTMTGVSRLACRLDGEWNPRQAPVCDIKNCGEFGDILYGATFQDNTYTDRNTYGSVVEVTCERGYILVGSPRVSCDANGNWGAKPVCEEVVCDPYPGFNSSCIGDTQLTNNLLFMVCRDDVSVTQTGPSMVRCRDNLWEPDPAVNLMACFCDCQVAVDNNVMTVRNLAEGGYLKHTQILDWSCKNKGTKANSGALKCVDGRMEAPRCIPAAGPITTVPVTGIVITTDPHTHQPSEESSNVGLIVGVIAGVLGAIGAAIVGVCCWQQKKRKQSGNPNSNENAKMMSKSDTAGNPEKSEEVVALRTV